MRAPARAVVLLVPLAGLALGALTRRSSPPPALTLATATPHRLAVHVVRLLPGQDPKAELERFVRERGLEAACVLACAGSLERAALRYADRSETTILEEKLEIVSLTGTVSSLSGSHLHVAVATGDGRTLGGHLKEGSRVYTTAEIFLGVVADVRLVRAKDARTGWSELFLQEPDGGAGTDSPR